jgi:CubicO group peptidase (beta-lactamase class C family)
MRQLDDVLRSGLGRVYTAASVEVRQHGKLIYQAVCGDLDPDGKPGGHPVQPDTWFDLASLTKLFITTAFLRLVDAGRVSLDQSVGAVLSEFNGLRPIRAYEHPLIPGSFIEIVPPTDQAVDASAATFRQLLTHSSGLPAWRNLHLAEDNAARLRLCQMTPFAYPTSSRVLYSDIGLILVGLALERLTGLPLDSALRQLVLEPLHLTARYGPLPRGNVAPTEICPWRKRRLVGEVDDENCATLDGIAGHAGLFGTAADVASLGQLYLDGGGELISAPLAHDATHVQVENRGLGWAINTVPSSAGARFSAESYGHTGFTGTSLWVDPARQLACALLTNRVFFGRDAAQVEQFRPLFHDTLIACLD